MPIRTRARARRACVHRVTPRRNPRSPLRRYGYHARLIASRTVHASPLHSGASSTTPLLLCHEYPRLSADFGGCRRLDGDHVIRELARSLLCLYDRDSHALLPLDLSVPGD
jgi:hypothetical protein